MKATLITPTPNVSSSTEFYTILGFQQLSTNPFVFTDGKVHLEINPDRFTRAGIKLYQDSWEKELETIQTLTKIHAIENGYLLSDPSGIWIYLMEETPAFAFRKDAESSSTLGNYAGVSLETTDLETSTELYQSLGFSKIAGSSEQGYVSFDLRGFGINVMLPLNCPHLFFNPSMTYFNGQRNPEIIQNIRKLGIPITEEITVFNQEGLVDNIIIRDPGGYGFFIFND